MSSMKESAIRSRAKCRGFRVEKSRQGFHSNNLGEYQLIAVAHGRNMVVLGSDYDASLEQISHYLETHKALIG